MASPLLPGWVAVAHGMADITRALEVAIREAELVRYATERGYIYDAQPFIPDVEAPPILRMVRRGDGSWNWRVSHDPAGWVPLDNGKWRSPSGNEYRPDSQVVQRVVRLRLEQGLAVRNPDAPDALAAIEAGDPMRPSPEA